MKLATNYLGLKLRSPLVPSASPLAEDVDNIRRMEDAGAAAVVLYSLFEEQIVSERLELDQRLAQGTQSFAEALTFFPELGEYRVGPEEYLALIADAKKSVEIPIIASLNGSSHGGWIHYAQDMQQAGADAIELNIYHIPTDMDQSGSEVEESTLEIFKSVKSSVTIPVAVKLSPFFSNFANMAKRLDDAGADGLVLFNRFYQPDIDLDALEISPNVLLSTPMAMRLPLRWIAILYGRIKADLAATSGIYRGSDAIKMLMAGADITMLCSVLFKRGIDSISTIEQEMLEWLDKHEYESIEQLKGSMSQKNCPDPSSFERAQYMKALSTYRPTGV